MFDENFSKPISPHFQNIDDVLEKEDIGDALSSMMVSVKNIHKRREVKRTQMESLNFTESEVKLKRNSVRLQTKGMQIGMQF